jgi:hypothetical protein
MASYGSMKVRFIVVCISVLLQGLACVLLHEGMGIRTHHRNDLASEKNVSLVSAHCLLHVFSARKIRAKEMAQATFHMA